MRPGLTTPLRMAKYFLTHPRLFGALPVLRDANRVPASYATIEYHGLHAFRWIGADGSARFVRYHWVPATGEKTSRSAAQSKGPGLSHRRAECAPRKRAGAVRLPRSDRRTERLDGRPVALRGESTQIATVGALEITGLETERERGGDIVVFDPMRVTDGIEPSDDPVLHFRTLAYSASVKLRTGVDRGPEAPPT